MAKIFYGLVARNLWRRLAHLRGSGNPSSESLAYTGVNALSPDTSCSIMPGPIMEARPPNWCNVCQRHDHGSDIWFGAISACLADKYKEAKGQKLWSWLSPPDASWSQHPELMVARKIVLVTGANRGIGYETVKVLLESDQSYHVFLGSRSLVGGRKAVEQLQQECYGLPNTVEVLQLDVSDDSSILSAVDTVKMRTHRIDVLVNNAGRSTDPQPCSS